MPCQHVLPGQQPSTFQKAGRLQDGCSANHGCLGGGDAGGVLDGFEL
jgi:hypothetical protein